MSAKALSGPNFCCDFTNATHPKALAEDEILYHPKLMISDQVRHLALVGDSRAIRNLAGKLSTQGSQEEYLVDIYELIALLSETNFEATLAKCELIQFKYSKLANFADIQRILNSTCAQVAFAHGNFDHLEELVLREIADIDSGVSKLTIGESLQLRRLLAQKYYIMNEFGALRELVKNLPNISNDAKNVHAFYFLNAIKCLSLSERGEHRAALKATQINIDIAKQFSYCGLIAPIDAMYVMADSLFGMSNEQEGFDLFIEIAAFARKVNQWPWFFKADGQIARQTAFKNQISESLEIIRKERDLNASFKFENGLSFLPDANELFVRYLIKDVERVEVLLNRLPELTLVKQLRALKDEWEGKDILTFINNLPFETPREKIYKNFALTEYYQKNESQAVRYMHEAMKLVEETGATEFLLRQYKLFDIIIKAVAKKPTPYQEDIVRKITERVKIHEKYSDGGLSDPLTKRELEILRHLVTEKTTKSIGETLNISMNTMKTHVRNIYQKLGVDSREKAIAKAKALFLI